VHLWFLHPLWNKIATLVALSYAVLKKFQKRCYASCCMSPIALNEEGVDAAISKEIEIAKIFTSEGKPEAMLDNIAKGKLLVSLKIIL
jgi:elongation factor Ts